MGSSMRSGGNTRNAVNNTDSQLFYSYSTDAGVTWSPNIAISNSFNPFEGYPGGSGKLALPGLPNAALHLAAAPCVSILLPLFRR